MHISDVLIHINETANQAEQNDLVEQLRTLQGVIAPAFSKQKPPMLFVSYNAEAIDATALIEKVRECGFKARLVGL